VSHAVGVTRLSCALGGATQEQSAELTRRRRANENPKLESLKVVREVGEEEDLPEGESEPTLTFVPGARVQLRVSVSIRSAVSSPSGAK